jgi:hypothetical protein
MTAGWQTTVYMTDPSGPAIPQYMDYALDQVVVEYASRGIPLPGRMYWTVGQEATDCEQVVLGVQSAALGLAGVPTATSQCDGPVSLTLTVQIMRCVPVANARGDAPSPAAINEHSVPVATDIEIMMYGLPSRFDVYGTGIIASASAVGAEGGLLGSLGTYTVNL